MIFLYIINLNFDELSLSVSNSNEYSLMEHFIWTISAESTKSSTYPNFADWLNYPLHGCYISVNLASLVRQGAGPASLI